MLIFKILSARIGEPIEGLNDYFSFFIQIFRTSIGDVQDPMTEIESTQIVVFIYIVYLMMLFLTTVILNNFMIAKVSQEYENFQMTFTLQKYRNQIRLIKEHLMYEEFLGLENTKQFTMAIMLQSNKTEVQNNEFQGIVKSIKNKVTRLIQDLRVKLCA